MYQNVVLVGYLGSDPEMRYAPSGQPVTNFSMATSRKYSDSSGKQVEEIAWFRVSVWGRQAETCNEFLRKGSLVLAEGRLTADKSGNPKIWTGKDGMPHASFEITAELVRFLGGKGKTGDSASAGIGEEI